MPIWIIVLLGLASVPVLFNIALFVFPHSRFLNWLTRPICARFLTRMSDMSYRQAYAYSKLMDIRERHSHRSMMFHHRQKSASTLSQKKVR